jgi:branched-chain amino acid transport system permease protein
MAMAQRFGVWLVAAAVILLLPVIFTSGFSLTILNQIGVLIIFALAYNMLLGQGGMLSFGHAVYFGLAGYCAAHYLNGMARGDLIFIPVTLMPLLGGVVGLVFGTLIGYVSTRRAGTTFAMISLGFAEMATALTLILVAFFNGEEGVNTDRWVGPEPFGITFGPNVEVYYLIGFWCLVAVAAMYALTRTPFGRMCNAVRDNPERVEFIGYSTHRVRWLAFALSSFFAGAAGALHAVNVEHIGFEKVGVAQSGVVLFMVYIGGAGNFAGPILGAILITLLNSNLSQLTEAWYFYLGIIFMVIVMFSPGGLAGLVMLHAPIWNSDIRLFRPMLVPYAAGIGSALIAVTGLIGLVELTYFLSTRSTRDTVTQFLWTDVDVATAPPWLLSAAVALIGIFLCTRAFPVLAASYNDTIAEIKARTAA